MNKTEGKGVYTFINGSKYEGQWKKNEPEGYGEMIWLDGEKYTGKWV